MVNAGLARTYGTGRVGFVLFGSVHFIQDDSHVPEALNPLTTPLPFPCDSPLRAVSTTRALAARKFSVDEVTDERSNIQEIDKMK